MLDRLREQARVYNHRITMLPINRLFEIQKELEEFKNTENLNGFQNWILSDIYKYDFAELKFQVRSLILVAVPHPMYVNINIHYEGRTYKTRALGASDMMPCQAYIAEAAAMEGYQVQEMWQLPLKRLAVQSGLATYGRNNITYVDGLGSNISYTAFVSDAESEEDFFRPMCHEERCDSCGLCIGACPTGAILQERFLIDNERCLSRLNEGEGEFPEWLPKQIHHTLYDCLRCQEACPLNLEVADEKEEIQTIDFSEEETAMLLDGKGWKDFPEEFVVRTRKIGLFAYNVPLARNIRALMDAQSE